MEEKVEADEEVEIRPSSSRFVADPLLPVITEQWPPLGPGSNRKAAAIPESRIESCSVLRDANVCLLPDANAT